MLRMISQQPSDYYRSRQAYLLVDFDKVVMEWRPVIADCYGEAFASAVLADAKVRFETFIPGIPYIGGDENHLTHALVESVEILALFWAMEAVGETPDETGKVLHDAVLRLPPPPPIPPDQLLSTADLMQYRRQRAERSLERRYPDDFVYEFVEGDGETFDYGYDFLECASEKFYRVQGVLAFLPYYCFLDFPKCERGGLGLMRRGTLAEGCQKCDFRFREGGIASQKWPPSFALGKMD